jgi:hypothetical protein
MSKSITLLNYTALFVLFITSFVFIFQKNASILGYVLLFITNIAFMVYVTGELIANIDINSSYFGILFSTIAVISSSILHFVCLIFIIMMISNLHVKFTVKNGLPINIPEPYKSELYNFNILMITTFCICSLLLYIIKFKSDKLDINFYELLKRGSILLYYRYSLLLISIVLSILTIVISVLQIIRTNKFSKLSRQQVNGAEYKKSKNNTKDLNLQNTIPNVANTLKEKIGSIVNDSIFPIL